MTESVTAPLLEVRDLGVDFDIGRGQLHAVRGVSFTLHSRDRLGIVGESGCGKSTVVLAMMGLLPPNAEVSGQVLFNGVDILAGGDTSMRPHGWCDISMVFQGAMNAFNPVRTVGDQIAEPIRMHRKASRRDAEKRVGELLDMVGIPASRAARYPHEFSGGQRQRLAIARALVIEPRLLVLDEPTSALDVSIQKQVLDLLQDLQARRGLSYLLITHDVAVVRAMAHTVLVMKDGAVIEAGSVDDVLARPREAYTRELVEGAG
jgi:ABC-type microcin C transport system duplicated ATPase subunit YejF